MGLLAKVALNYDGHESLAPIPHTLHYNCQNFMHHHPIWRLAKTMLNLQLQIHTVAQKAHTQSSYDHFDKRAPISIILSFLDSEINCHRASNLLPHYLVKLECSTVATFYS